jgi:uncharacterized RDD family membrane protein YckC
VKDLRRRLLSWWWDYLVILAWLAFTALVLGLPNAAGWIDLEPVWSRPIAADLALTLITVVPYFGYLVVTERGPAHATWGKRRSHLFVEGADGSPAQPSRIVVRNLVKVLPWQLGHMAAMRFATGAQPGVAAACYAASLILLIAVAGPVLLGRRGLHDRIAGTHVIPGKGSDQEGS